MHFSRTSGTALLRQPGPAATVLLFLLTVLSSAGSPLDAGMDSVANFPSAGRLAAMTRHSGYLGVVAERSGVLSNAQAGRAMARREKLPPDQRERLDAVVGAASPDAQEYLVEGFAAGHTVAEIAEFSAVIAGRAPRWLDTRLRPIDPSDVGSVQFRGNTISQYDGTTCGSTTIVVARALVDPLYALWLTTGGRPGTDDESDERFLDRLRTEEQRVHDETDVLWPQIAGTPPWGLSEQLGRDPAGLGARYRWVPALQAIPAFSGTVLRQALAAADQGYPVPVLIGDMIPRHYVLLLGDDAEGATFYEPTAGEVVLVSPDELKHQDFSSIGYPNLMGVIVPSGPPGV